ncbi:MAG: ABC transporter permease [Flavobacteriaceae bacterium]|nr:ABC transporter permease [Flavobacteriaceae bacterium]
MLPLFFARRYFFSKHTRSAVNVISLISVAGFAFGTMALIIVLSVFNGFDTVVNSLYKSYDPDLKVQPTIGKFFLLNDGQLSKLKYCEGVKSISRVLEENALIRYGQSQTIATMKGVDNNYFTVSNISSTISMGDALPWKTPEFAIVGRGLGNKLDVDFGGMEPFTVFMPDAGEVSVLNPEGAFATEEIFPTHEFAIQQEIDGKNLIVPLAFAQTLLKDKSKLSSLEIQLKSNADKGETKARLAKILGKDYTIKDRSEQHSLLNRIMKSEKQVSYIILCLILLVASFNMVASLIMLVLEKREDIITLVSMGASRKLIRRIFLNEGLMITIVGTVFGLGLGFLLCWLQMTYGFIKIGQAETLVIDSYPVAINPFDFVVVAITALVVGLATSVYPAVKAARA